MIKLPEISVTQLDESLQNLISLYNAAKASPSLKLYNEIVEAARIPADALGSTFEQNNILDDEGKLSGIGEKPNPFRHYLSFFYGGDENNCHKLVISYQEIKLKKWKRVGILPLPIDSARKRTHIVYHHYPARYPNDPLCKEGAEGIELLISDAKDAILKQAEK